jgi:hypothetical protein
MLRDGEVEVALTPSEMMSAGIIGLAREVKARRGRYANRFEYGGEQFAWGKHVIGAMAECALAKAFGVFWCMGVQTFRSAGDVGDLEVRWAQRTTGRDGTVREARLKVRPDEKDDAKVVLVTGTAPKFTVHGWIRAGDAKRHEWLDEPVSGPPAFFVPMEELWALDRLRERTVA